MCDPTETPSGFAEKIPALRARLKGWLEHSESGSTPMTLWDCIQFPDGLSDCYARAATYIPGAWGVATPSKVVAWDKLELKGIPIDAHQAAASKLGTGENQKSWRCKWPQAGEVRPPAASGGFHWLLVVAVGETPSGRRFSAIFDPDVSATKESLTAWALCKEQLAGLGPAEKVPSGLKPGFVSAAAPRAVPVVTPAAAAAATPPGTAPSAAMSTATSTDTKAEMRKKVLRRMILGEDDSGRLGPLIRYHYEPK